MNEEMIKSKYDLNGRRHAITLFVQMILVVIGIILCVLELTTGTTNNMISADVLVMFLLITGFSLVGYKYPYISVRMLLFLIAGLDLIATAIMMSRGIIGLHILPVFAINVLLIIAALTVQKNFRLSQTLLCICLVIDTLQFILKLIFEPGQSVLYYAMSFQLLIMEGSLLLINYSHHLRQQSIQSRLQNSAARSAEGGGAAAGDGEK